jgi:O-succinylbenzoate synthase
MLESGIGRAASLALARSRDFAVPADLSPPTEYLDHDLLRSPLRLEPDGIHVPAGPGLGISVDRDALDGFTSARRGFGSF